MVNVAAPKDLPMCLFFLWSFSKTPWVLYEILASAQCSLYMPVYHLQQQLLSKISHQIPSWTAQCGKFRVYHVFFRGSPKKKFRLKVYVVPGPKKFHEYTLKFHRGFRGKFFCNFLFFPWNFVIIFFLIYNFLF